MSIQASLSVSTLKRTASLHIEALLWNKVDKIQVWSRNPFKSPSLHQKRRSHPEQARCNLQAPKNRFRKIWRSLSPSNRQRLTMRSQNPKDLTMEATRSLRIPIWKDPETSNQQALSKSQHNLLTPLNQKQHSQTKLKESERILKMTTKTMGLNHYMEVLRQISWKRCRPKPRKKMHRDIECPKTSSKTLRRIKHPWL